MMTEVILKNASYFYMALIVLALIFICLTVVMSFFIPKPMTEKYFKKPYFNDFEIAFFTGFPYGFLKAPIFLRLGGFPKSGRKRKILGIEDVTPKWFSYLGKIYVYSYLLLFSFLAGFTVVLGIVYFS